MQALVNHDVTIHGDGSQTRSFCYVDDLIRGIIALADSSEVGPINLGNNIEITVSKLAEMVLRICGSKSNVVFTQAMEDDPQQRCPDLAQAKDKLGWEPQVSVEDGLKKTIEWFKQNHN